MGNVIYLTAQLIIFTNPVMLQLCDIMSMIDVNFLISPVTQTSFNFLRLQPIIIYNCKFLYLEEVVYYDKDKNIISKVYKDDKTVVLLTQETVKRRG